MPLFYMHIRECSEFLEDADGLEFPSLAEARAEAMKCARELMSERVFRGKKLNDGTFEIADETGQIVLVLPFQDSLD